MSTDKNDSDLVNVEEQQYLDLIKLILDRGSLEETRNGKVRTWFGTSMRFSLKDGAIPLLTTKQLAWKTCFKELMWFINGRTDNADLREKGVHIWDGNSTREFLDANGFPDRLEGDLGPIYGHQWRHFNAPYTNSSADYSGQGVDQLAYIINSLKDPSQLASRRLVMSAWNPCQNGEMAIPPCHILAQFHVREGRYLSCALYQRSGDVGLGVPFNIASYSFLTHILAKHCGLVAEDFVYFLGNAHIYEDHIPVLEEQIERTPLQFPKMAVSQTRENIEDYRLEDIDWISPYQHLGSLKMKMVA